MEQFEVALEEVAFLFLVAMAPLLTFAIDGYVAVPTPRDSRKFAERFAARGDNLISSARMSSRLFMMRLRPTRRRIILPIALSGSSLCEERWANIGIGLVDDIASMYTFFGSE